MINACAPRDKEIWRRTRSSASLLDFERICVHNLRSCQRLVSLAGDGSLETPEQVLLHLAFGQPALDVGLGAGAMARVHQRDAVQGFVAAKATTIVPGFKWSRQHLVIPR